MYKQATDFFTLHWARSQIVSTRATDHILVARHCVPSWAFSISMSLIDSKSPTTSKTALKISESSQDRKWWSSDLGGFFPILLRMSYDVSMLCPLRGNMKYTTEGT